MGMVNGYPANQTNGDYYSSPEYFRAVRLGAVHDANKARLEGRADGYDNGYDNGLQVGYDNGYNDAIERGNRELLKADGYIRAHIADKERLQQQVNEQAHKINQLLEHIAALEATMGRKDEAMRAIQDSPLPQMARELQAHNDQLRAQVQALQADNEAKAQECIERTWQTNRAATVLNAMRSTLESLTADKESSQTAAIEQLFCEHYKKEVATGLEKGYLRAPLEDDAVFAKTMPSTHRFLTSILQSVNERIEIDNAGHHDDGSWVPDGS